ncbi:MAG TPA: PilZ domain-containing protein [Vicinamibacteria bacterium]|jgi:hypothetical protein|nr:PilZ domain-containing protein [Vicinamibacteria bacterium]
MRVGLHSTSCSCRGGAWVVLGEVPASPCAGSGNGPDQGLVVSLGEWKSLGKPATAEDYAEAKARVEGGERREFQRFEATIPVRLGRMPFWKNPTAQAEDTATEVIARGGALVLSHMAVEKGEVVVFEAEGGFRTRAEVMYVTATKGATAEAVLRLGLRFLDAPFPDNLIPAGAKPLTAEA